MTELQEQIKKLEDDIRLLALLNERYHSALSLTVETCRVALFTTMPGENKDD